MGGSEKIEHFLNEFSFIINKHFDHIDTKFAEQNMSLYKSMVSVGLGVVAILSLVITLVAFLR